MPLRRAVTLIIVALSSLAVLACASAPLPASDPIVASAPDSGLPTSTARMPRAIRIGAVNMVIQRVEPEVSRAEIAAAIGPMIFNAPVCLRWPALWMEQTRRNSFVVRYDMMVRDWGQSAATDAEARMQEFVELGLVQKEAGSDPLVVTYVLTDAGQSYFSGVLEPGRRPRFCAPSERRLVAISATEQGQFPCGTLRVLFTHDGEAWPSWVRSETTRARLAQVWPAAGAVVDGSVSLSRQWFRRQDLPQGAQNGGLRSTCYDARRQEVVGDDLELSIGAID